MQNTQQRILMLKKINSLRFDDDSALKVSNSVLKNLLVQQNPINYIKEVDSVCQIGL